MQAVPVQEKPKPWLELAQRLATVSCEYEVEVRWAHLRDGDLEIPDGQAPTPRQQAAKLLKQAMICEGDSPPATETLLGAMDVLWDTREEDPRHKQLGRYRITRGAGRVLQYYLGDPKMHEMRTAKLSVTYLAPPGQLLISHPNTQVMLFEPQNLLEPLPCDGSEMARRKWTWEKLDTYLYRAGGREEMRATVLTSRDHLPIASWRSYRQRVDEFIAGFYAWTRDASGEFFPARALTLRSSEGAIYVMDYSVQVQRVDDPEIQPILRLPGLESIRDDRKPKEEQVLKGVPEEIREFVQTGVAAD
ncbi:MAG: hypothetical protein R3F33_09600 [Planctomycetota bacterium]